MMSSRVSQVATPDPIPLIQYRRFRRSLSSPALNLNSTWPVLESLPEASAQQKPDLEFVGDCPDPGRTNIPLQTDQVTQQH